MRTVKKDPEVRGADEDDIARSAKNRDPGGRSIG